MLHTGFSRVQGGSLSHTTVFRPPPLAASPYHGPLRRRRRHLATLPRGHSKRSILGQREIRRPIVLIPGEFLRADGPVNIRQRVGRRLGVINNVILRSIGACGKTGVARGIHPFEGVLVKNTALAVFTPGLVLHGIVTHQLQHPEAVKGRVDPRGRVNDKVLPCGWIDELLGPFVGRQTRVGAAVGDAFPRLVGH